jgi:hypothetical protein
MAVLCVAIREDVSELVGTERLELVIVDVDIR